MRTITAVAVVLFAASSANAARVECKWQQRIKGGWVKRTTWLVIDGNGWHVIDA